jgi:hypothetical protein
MYLYNLRTYDTIYYGYNSYHEHASVPLDTMSIGRDHWFLMLDESGVLWSSGVIKC